jgi:excisionase family DNA binding protein
MERQVLRLEAAAEALSVSHWTIRAWIKQGLIRTVRLGKLRMIPQAGINRIAEDGTSAIKTAA